MAQLKHACTCKEKPQANGKHAEANKQKHNGGIANRFQHAISIQIYSLNKLPIEKNTRTSVARNLIVDGGKGYYPKRRLTLCTVHP